MCVSEKVRARRETGDLKLEHHASKSIRVVIDATRWTLAELD